MTLRTRLAAAIAAASAVVGIAGGAVTRPATATPAYGANKWALIIGVDHYKRPTHPTFGGDGDARTMYGLLQDNGWPYDHIYMLQDRVATQANIRAGFQWLVDHSDDSSFSVFMYSGHVKVTSGDLDHDGEQVDEWMWPSDNKLIADRELTNWLVQVRGQMWVDLSGCEAAGLDDGIGAPNRLVTAASQENEKGFERPDWHESVFNGTFIDQGMRQHMAPHSGDRISIQDAFAFSASEAPRLTARQRPGPQHPKMSGGDGAAWYLDPPPPPPPPPPPDNSQPPADQPPQQCTLVCT